MMWEIVSNFLAFLKKPELYIPFSTKIKTMSTEIKTTLRSSFQCAASIFYATNERFLSHKISARIDDDEIELKMLSEISLML